MTVAVRRVAQQGIQRGQQRHLEEGAALDERVERPRRPWQHFTNRLRHAVPREPP